jgi:hypothetical protein
MSQKSEDVIAVIGGIGAICLPFIVLGLIWFTGWTMVRVLLTDLVVLGTCWVLTE